MSMSNQFEEELSRVTWFQLMIYLQFMVAASILIFSLVGVAVGYTVSCLLLLSFVQFVIAIPGCVFNTQRSLVFLSTYITLQSVTGLSEFVWFLYGLGSQAALIQVGLAILTVIQLSSVLTALFLRDSKVSCCGSKDNDETHLRPFPDTKPPTAFPSSSLESGYLASDLVSDGFSKKGNKGDSSVSFESAETQRSSTQSPKKGRRKSSNLSDDKEGPKLSKENRRRVRDIKKKMKKHLRELSKSGQSSESGESMETAKEKSSKSKSERVRKDERKETEKAAAGTTKKAVELSTASTASSERRTGQEPFSPVAFDEKDMVSL